MSQQIGAALGLALLTTISVTATNEKLPEAATVIQKSNDAAILTKASEALIYGYTSAFAVGALMLVAAALVAVVAVNTKQKQSAVTVPV